MALFSAKDSKDKDKNKAPVNPGAGSFSGDQANKDDESKAEALKKVKADTEVSFYVPFAPSGKSSISLPHPVVDKDGLLTGEVEHKQIKLKDKFFTVLKKDVSNSSYYKKLKELMVEAGLEMFSTVKNLEELKAYRSLVALKPMSKSKTAKIQKIFGCFNPEHLSSEQNFTLAFNCGDKDRKFVMVKGRLFTSESELHQIFLKNGFEDMGYVKDSVKPSKEILPKEAEEDE